MKENWRTRKRSTHLWPHTKSEIRTQGIWVGSEHFHHCATLSTAIPAVLMVCVRSFLLVANSPTRALLRLCLRLCLCLQIAGASGVTGANVPKRAAAGASSRSAFATVHMARDMISARGSGRVRRVVTAIPALMDPPLMTLSKVQRWIKACILVFQRTWNSSCIYNISICRVTYISGLFSAKCRMQLSMCFYVTLSLRGKRHIAIIIFPFFSFRLKPQRSSRSTN